MTSSVVTVNMAIILEANSDETPPVVQNVSLSEERKRTGRYAAIGTAIFLTLLGCYEALDRGTWPYAALFGSALIMFVYVFWILYASNRARAMMRLRERQFLELSTQITEDDKELHSNEIINNQLKENNIKMDKEKNQDHGKESASALDKENNLQEVKEKQPENSGIAEDENERLLQKRNAYYVNRSYSIA